jgi:hypothetical protein
MITVQTSMSPVFVGTPTGEYGFTNVGTYTFASVQYISTYTNNPVATTNLLDGSFLIVDAAGNIEMSPGPNLVGAATVGIAVAAVTVGVILGQRYLLRSFYGMAGIPRTGAE